jgi:Raf kinase inhibitor-like YbhB/YbcL family protein
MGQAMVTAVRSRLRSRLPARATLRAAAAAAAVLLLGGCSLLAGHAASLNDPLVMTVTSPEFGHDVPIPAEYTCRGGQSPPVAWSGAPADTKALALVMDDSGTPISPYVYWIVFNISTATPDIQAGRVPPGALEAQNSRGTTGYAAPCPDGPHSYRFTVYALNAPLQLPRGASLTAASSAIASHAIGYGRLSAEVVP